MRYLLLALAVIATPAAAADQFDLVCKGKQRVMPSTRWKPYEVRYRVDLGRMVYCRFQCQSLQTIAKADDARIVFQVPANDTRAAFVIHHVDRTDGKWKYLLGGDSDAEGFCKREAFSGFPAAKF